VDFLTISMDQLVHVGAYNRYMFGGKAKVPMVLRTEGGVGRCIAAHHSESLEAWLMHPPGLYVVMPSTPYDAKGLLKAAIQSDNPVVFIEHKATYGQTGLVPEGDYIIRWADINGLTRRSSATAEWPRELDAAKVLVDEHGIDAEVIDVRRSAAGYEDDRRIRPPNRPADRREGFAGVARAARSRGST
jgi:pyruvate/2-oxoglutarate/acetoin dehydrogenase E1 component